MDCRAIRDWASFHAEFSQVFGFPSFYGKNMDAWIDCMTSLDKPEDGMSTVHCAYGSILKLELNNARDFARNLQNQGQTFLDLSKIGILVRSVNESSVDESPEGKLQAGIVGTFNEYSSNALSEKMKGRTRAAASAGRFPWRAPIGYANVGGNSGPNIMRDLERAPLVTRAFELVATGRYKKTEVLKILTDEGLRTLKGRPLTPQTLQAVLVNRLYAGWITLPSDDSFVPVQGLHTPLVSQAMFDRVQEILTGKRLSIAPKKKFNPEFPLKCLLKCEACGTPMTGGLCKKTFGYYWCRKPGCRAVKSVPKAKLEGQFVTLLRKLRPSTQAVSELPKIAAKVWTQRQGDSELRVKRLTARREEQGRLKRALRDAMLRGTITGEQYKLDEEEFRAEIAAIELDLRAIDSERAELGSFIRFAELHLSNVAHAWEIAGPEQRQRVQNLLFKDGLLYSSSQGILNRSKSSLFSVLEAARSEKGLLASPTGFEPVSSP